MIYSFDDLKNILSNPIDSSRWGSDTHTVVGLIKKITDASCTSCALRRNLTRIKEIINKYGDDIVYKPASYAVKSSKKDKTARIPCNDCVAKHLSQAYVLQSEFHQGYIEYLSLIEAHLQEALEECPPDNTDLKTEIQQSLRKIAVDRVPNVPEVIYTGSLVNEPKPYNKHDEDKSSNILTPILKDGVDMVTELNKVPYTILRGVNMLLSNDKYMDTYDAISPEHRRRKLGSMAQSAEFIAKYSPSVSSLLRDRRLALQDCIYRESSEDIDPIWILNTDIIEAIQKALKNTQK